MGQNYLSSVRGELKGPYWLRGQAFDFSRVYIMGVVNVTPDSFSDGGQFLCSEDAMAQIYAYIEAGVDMIDIGAESTRPYSQSVSADEEIDRLGPVLDAYQQGGYLVPLSVDTTKYDVAVFALDQGADIINDVSGLTVAPRIAELVGRTGKTLILMHMKGPPQTMQDQPVYQDLIGEIYQSLSESCELARVAGVSQIIVDPGIGFGKTVADNLRIIRELHRFRAFNLPILIGTSRKSFLGAVTGSPVEDRLAETIASSLAAVLGGAGILRVHDVKAVRNAVRVFEAILDAGGSLS